MTVILSPYLLWMNDLVLIPKISTSFSSSYCYMGWLFLPFVGCFTHIHQNEEKLLLLVTTCLFPKEVLKMFLLLCYKRQDLEGLFFSTLVIKQDKAGHWGKSEVWKWVSVLLGNLKLGLRAKTNHKLNDFVKWSASVQW